MRKKVTMYEAENEQFVMECGHTSPLFVHCSINIKKAFEKLQKKSLYRDCPECKCGKLEEVKNGMQNL